MTSINISAVVVGIRHRRELGDIPALAKSMREDTLLHPIVVNSQNQLIAGQRRLEAAKMLGWKEIPATTIDLAVARGEFAENAIRKDFSPSEIDSIRRTLEPTEKAAAKGRETEGRRPSGKFPEAGRARDKIGAFAGVSGRTVEKIAQVVEAAEREPEKYGPLVQEMNRTRKVDGVYRKLRQTQDEAKRLAIKPIIGKFGTIVVDPPWDHGGLSIAGRGRPAYAVMSQQELLALPIAQWANDECHLYLWSTNNFLLRAGELIPAWGFSYKTVITWVKPRIGLGSYFRSSTEQCLFAVKGDLTTRAKDIPTHFEAPAGAHSEKPKLFFDLAQRASYPPYLEVFARAEHAGWSAWGAGVPDAV